MSEEWTQERKQWGWLGKPPDSVIKKRGSVWKEWTHLSKEARRVAGMSFGQAKIKAAKEIERRRNEIIWRAEHGK